jgi:hypothetical protein
MIFLIQGSAAPTGYVFIGSVSAGVRLAGQLYDTIMRFDVYRKF